MMILQGILTGVLVGINFFFLNIRRVNLWILEQSSVEIEDLLKL